MSSDPELPDLFTRRQARDAGLSDRQVTHRLASGKLVAERHGLLRRATPIGRSDVPQFQALGDGLPNRASPKTLFRPPTADDPLPMQVRAALLVSPHRELVLSHASAARLWGLPMPVGGWPAAQFTATTGTARKRAGLNVHVAPLRDAEVVDLHDVRATSPARTVADCLRVLPGRDALAIADAALHRGLVTDTQVLETLAVQAGWQGVKAARQVLAMVDGARESPLESWSAWAFAHVGVPAPQWQVMLLDAGGRPIARADCWWLSAALVGEADGRSKYAIGAAERGGRADDLLDVLHAERRREQRLRAAGIDLIRWSPHDVLDAAAAADLGRRIRAALTLGPCGRVFDGVAMPASTRR